MLARRSDPYRRQAAAHRLAFTAYVYAVAFFLLFVARLLVA